MHHRHSPIAILQLDALVARNVVDGIVVYVIARDYLFGIDDIDAIAITRGCFHSHVGTATP